MMLTYRYISHSHTYDLLLSRYSLIPPYVYPVSQSACVYLYTYRYTHEGTHTRVTHMWVTHMRVPHTRVPHTRE